MWSNKFLDFVLESVLLMRYKIKVFFYPVSYRFPKIFTEKSEQQYLSTYSPFR